LVVDLACGIFLAVVTMLVAAGIGVVGVAALTGVVLILASVGIEAVLVRVRR
jgi:hypothetical protein